ncbi:MAG: hypothetical protein Kow006_30060 [Gammaproteobacteria bacterium]
MNRLSPAWLLLLLIPLLSACVGGGALPEEHFYRLPSAVSTPHFSSEKGTTIVVPRFKTAGLLNDRAIVYSDSRRPNGVASYHYHRWQDPPGVLVRDHLVDFLRQSGRFANAFAPTAGLQGDLRLLGRLLRFEQELRADRIDAVVEVEFTLLRNRQPLLGPKRYRFRHESEDRSLGATAEAMGIALSQLYGELITDIDRSLPPQLGQATQ